MKVIALISLIFFSLNVFSQGKIQLPAGKMKRSTICGGNCNPGNDGVLFVFKDYYAPDLDVENSDSSIAIQVLGRLVPDGDLSGSTPFFCNSDKSKSPFSYKDINAGGFQAHDIKYNKTSKAEIKVDATVEANMKELKLFEKDTAKLKKAEAELRAAYSKLKSKTFNVEGTYYEWQLNSGVVTNIKQGGELFKDCRKYMSGESGNSPMRLITAVGFVKFSVSYNSTSLDSLAFQIQSSLEKHGIKANLTASFKKSINSSLSASTKNLYAVISWRTIGKEHFLK